MYRHGPATEGCVFLIVDSTIIASNFLMLYKLSHSISKVSVNVFYLLSVLMCLHVPVLFCA